MTEERMNGQAPPAVTAEQGAIEKARDVLDAQVNTVLQVVVRGILTGLPGIAAQEALNSVARVSGQLLAGTLSGDIQAVTMIRKGIRDSFDAGVRKVPLVQAPAGGQQRPPQG